MQSKLEWGQKKLIKFEMKKGKSKKENNQLLKQCFPTALKGGERG